MLPRDFLRELAQLALPCFRGFGCGKGEGPVVLEFNRHGQRGNRGFGHTEFDGQEAGKLVVEAQELPGATQSGRRAFRATNLHVE